MSTINIDLAADTILNVMIGQQDENEVREVVFDFSGWYTTYGSGTISLAIQRPKDEWPYEGTLTVDSTNHKATWEISETDTAYAGTGQIQLSYKVGDAKKKSVVYRFTCHKSLGALGSVVTPVQIQTFIDEVEEALQTMDGKLDDMEDEITDVKSDLNDLLGGVPTNVRQAIYAILDSALYENDELSNYLNIIKSWSDIVTSLTINRTSASMSGSDTLQLIATTVPQNVSVSWTSSDDSIATVNSYGLVTSIGNGTAIITASVGYLTATCEVTVSGFASVTSIEAVYTQTSDIFTSDSLDSLKSDLVVTAYYDDSTSAVVTTYTLSGSLEGGTSTILVSFGGQTDTFDVFVLYALPSGYTQYDYIKNTQSDGTNGYKSAVFTGLDDTYGSSDYEHYLEFAYDSGTSTTEGGFFGLRKQAGTPNDSITIWQKYMSSNTSGYICVMKGYRYPSSGYQNTTPGSIVRIKFTYEGSNEVLYINDDKVIEQTAGTFEVGTGGEFALFKAQTGTTKSDTAGSIMQIQRIYKYTVKNISTGQYAAYMIPCKNSNNEAGFYDCVRNNFYTAYSGASNLSANND